MRGALFVFAILCIVQALKSASGQGSSTSTTTLKFVFNCACCHKRPSQLQNGLHRWRCLSGQNSSDY
ncbi:unnamed protein product [Dicrocoelium dendriticum]|nr:unnamed protein product [Dicrocoelium dendriticum]